MRILCVVLGLLVVTPSFSMDDGPSDAEEICGLYHSLQILETSIGKEFNERLRNPPEDEVEHQLECLANICSTLPAVIIFGGLLTYYCIHSF